jgi:L-lactate permease
MFHQLLTPVGGSLFLSFLVGLIPIAVVLVLLGIVRLPAWQAALAGLIAGWVLALWIWQMPVGLATQSTLNGFAFALWPVMWIVWTAMWLYNITVRTGTFDIFRRWMIHEVPPDRRILLLIIGFSFGALMEGIAGFGTPVAIASALLIGLGFPVLEALTLTLIFNTSPVAFGALGVPITTLAQVTGLPANTLGAMVGRQLPFFALLLPFYAVVVLAGFRGLRGVWPVALVAGASFAMTQFVVSNFVGPQLPDILASLISLICVILFVRVWQPPDLDQYRARFPTPVAPAGARATPAAAPAPAGPTATARTEARTPIGEQNIPAPTATGVGPAPTAGEAVLAWLPWVLVSLVVIIWTFAQVAHQGEQSIHWPGLDLKVFLTLYGKPYKAIYTFQPLGTGTAILVTVLLTALALRTTVSQFFGALADTWMQLRFAILTVVLIVGLAYLFNYSGMAYTDGLALSKVGGIFPFFAAFIGWIACSLSGSDTSSNALFGNLQVAAAHQLHLSPVLMAATNSSGAVMSKMVSPQNVVTGTSTTPLAGREGLVIRRTFIHSIILEVLLGLLALLQQYVVPQMIPR